MEMKLAFVIAGALAISGCASGYQAEYRTDCNTTGSDLQLRIHDIATDLAAKIGAPVRHSESLEPAIEYDIDLPSGQIVLREYASKITIKIARGTDDAAANRVRELIEQTLQQNSCKEWQFS